MRKTRKQRRLTVDEAAARFPLGAPVRFFPVAGEPAFEMASVRSAPWALGHGQVVVSITGRAGGVCVEHLQIDFGDIPY